MIRNKSRLILVSAGLFVFAGAVLAQNGGQQQPAKRGPASGGVWVSSGGPGEQGGFIAPVPRGEGQVVFTAEQGGDATFVFSEMGLQNKVVTGAPYSAEAITESVQVLADGNRIVHRSSAKLFRDTDGRTRREQTMASVGPWTAEEAPTTVLINDPVGGVNYVLQTRDRVARKMAVARVSLAPQQGGEADELKRRVEAEVRAVASPRMAGQERGGSSPAPKVEPLGTQEIDGVVAEGTRTTTTIPAGKIGNEQPIQIVSERWYSPDLQMVVMSKQSDPRFGESTFKLTNISRDNPAKSLFEVPPDYTVEENAPPLAPIMRKKMPDEEK